MRAKELDPLPPEAVIRLDPVRVQEYARATGWKQEPRLGRGQTAVYERPESRLEQFKVPLSRDLTDYDLLMASAVAMMARFEKRPGSELLAELLFPPSDVLKFGESSCAVAAGDVPFEHGLALFTGARKTLLAAACSVRRPQQSFHPRLSLADADQFLSQCRMGQTERGSFVITVACPLHAVPAPPDLFLQPFTRQVTALLMRSLHRLSRSLEVADTEAILRAADNEPVLSANLCEGLLDMTPEGDDATLTISASYARSLPLARDQVIPSTVLLRRDMFPQIEYLAGRLRPAATSAPQFLVGFVETLNGRPNADNRPEGQVTLRVIPPDGEGLRARADLNAEDYARADQAHMHNLPFSLEGILVRTGRTYRIDDVRNFEVLRVEHEVSAP